MEKQGRKRFNKGYYSAPVSDAALQEIAQSAIDVLLEHANLTTLEQLLGLSQGYLSSLHRGHKIPSPVMAAGLHIMARYPTGNIDALAELWSARQRSPESSPSLLKELTGR